MPSREFHTNKNNNNKNNNNDNIFDFRQSVDGAAEVCTGDKEEDARLAYKAKAKRMHDPDYIKNVVLEYIKNGGDEAMLPDDMMDLDAVLGCTLAMIGANYNVSDEDISGLHAAVLWYAWAYHECIKRGDDWVRDLHGGMIALEMGLNRDRIKQFRKVYEENLKGGPLGGKFCEVYDLEKEDKDGKD